MDNETSSGFEHDLNDPEWIARATPETEDIITTGFEYDEIAMRTMRNSGRGMKQKNRVNYTATITHELNAEWRNRFPMGRGNGIGSTACELSMRLFLAIVYDYQVDECIKNMVEVTGNYGQALDIAERLKKFADQIVETVTP